MNITCPQNILNHELLGTILKLQRIFENNKLIMDASSLHISEAWDIFLKAFKIKKSGVPLGCPCSVQAMPGGVLRELWIIYIIMTA